MELRPYVMETLTDPGLCGLRDSFEASSPKLPVEVPLCRGLHEVLKGTIADNHLGFLPLHCGFPRKVLWRFPPWWVDGDGLVAVVGNFENPTHVFLPNLG